MEYHRGMDVAPSLANKKLAQVAIVVRDIEAAGRRWAALLGVEVPKIIDVAPGRETNMTYRGEGSNAASRLAFFDLGGVQLELIEPIGDDSAWAEGLAEKGERVHHLAFWTEDMSESKRTLEAHGAPMIHRGDMGDGQYAYFDATEPFATFIELLEAKRTEVAS
jgi:catechol 2,3-dioxygenase-like lactoylglutathione lyase family enzyme